MSTPYPHNQPPGLGERLDNGLRAFGARALTHTLAFFAAITLALVGEPTAAHASGTFLAVFSAYIGLICLFPGGAFKSIDAFLPSGLGFLQAIIIALLGSPLHGALLAGGVQTFMQRALLSKGNMGTGWVALPFIFISGLALLKGHGHSHDAMSGRLLLVAASFAGVGLGGRALQRILQRTMLHPRYIRKLTASIERLEAGLNSRQLPTPLHQQALVLLGESRRYLQARPDFDRQMQEHIDYFEQTSQRISALASRREPNLWDMEAGQAHNAVLRSSNSLRFYLAHHPVKPDSAAPRPDAAKPESSLKPDNSGLSEAAHAQQNSIDRLLNKIHLLPPELQPFTETICRSARNLLDMVSEKPQTEHSVVQFLNRYLSATHRVIDEIIRLQRNRISAEAVRRQIERSQDLLARLETAFAAEHAHLLQADVINLNAELGVLDSLLKMDGH